MDNRKIKNRLINLHDYHENYSIELFMSDLIIYLGDDIDFDLKKMRNMVEMPGELTRFTNLAKTKKTHPVIEFIQKLFKELAKEDK